MGVAKVDVVIHESPWSFLVFVFQATSNFEENKLVFEFEKILDTTKID